MSSAILDAALRLVQHGWAIFPVNPRTKRPYSNKAHGIPDGEGGFYLATRGYAHAPKLLNYTSRVQRQALAIGQLASSEDKTARPRS